MKTTVCITGILLALSLTTTLGEDKKILPPTGLATTDAVKGNSLSAAWREKLTKSVLTDKATDQIASKRFVLSGPLVTLVKSDNPLQTFNPFAASNSDMHSDIFRRDPYLPPLRGFTLFRLEF